MLGFHSLSQAALSSTQDVSVGISAVSSNVSISSFSFSNLIGILALSSAVSLGTPTLSKAVTLSAVISTTTINSVVTGQPLSVVSSATSLGTLAYSEAYPITGVSGIYSISSTGVSGTDNDTLASTSSSSFITTFGIDKAVNIAGTQSTTNTTNVSSLIAGSVTANSSTSATGSIAEIRESLLSSTIGTSLVNTTSISSSTPISSVASTFTPGNIGFSEAYPITGVNEVSSVNTIGNSYNIAISAVTSISITSKPIPNRLVAVSANTTTININSPVALVETLAIANTSNSSISSTIAGQVLSPISITSNVSTLGVSVSDSVNGVNNSISVSNIGIIGGDNETLQSVALTSNTSTFGKTVTTSITGTNSSYSLGTIGYTQVYGTTGVPGNSFTGTLTAIPSGNIIANTANSLVGSISAAQIVFPNSISTNTSLVGVSLTDSITSNSGSISIASITGAVSTDITPRISITTVNTVTISRVVGLSANSTSISLGNITANIVFGINPTFATSQNTNVNSLQEILVPTNSINQATGNINTAIVTSISNTSSNLAAISPIATLVDNIYSTSSSSSISSISNPIFSIALQGITLNTQTGVFAKSNTTGITFTSSTLSGTSPVASITDIITGNTSNSNTGTTYGSTPITATSIAVVISNTNVDIKHSLTSVSSTILPSNIGVVGGDTDTLSPASSNAQVGSFGNNSVRAVVGTSTTISLGVLTAEISQVGIPVNSQSNVSSVNSYRVADVLSTNSQTSIYSYIAGQIIPSISGSTSIGSFGNIKDILLPVNTSTIYLRDMVGRISNLLTANFSTTQVGTLSSNILSNISAVSSTVNASSVNTSIDSITSVAALSIYNGNSTGNTSVGIQGNTCSSSISSIGTTQFVSSISLVNTLSTPIVDRVVSLQGISSNTNVFSVGLVGSNHYLIYPTISNTTVSTQGFTKDNIVSLSAVSSNFYTGTLTSSINSNSTPVGLQSSVQQVNQVVRVVPSVITTYTIIGSIKYGQDTSGVASSFKVSSTGSDLQLPLIGESSISSISRVGVVGGDTDTLWPSTIQSTLGVVSNPTYGVSLSPVNSWAIPGAISCLIPREGTAAQGTGHVTNPISISEVVLRGTSISNNTGSIGIGKEYLITSVSDTGVLGNATSMLAPGITATSILGYPDNISSITDIVSATLVGVIGTITDNSMYAWAIDLNAQFDSTASQSSSINPTTANNINSFDASTTTSNSSVVISKSNSILPVEVVPVIDIPPVLNNINSITVNTFSSNNTRIKVTNA